MELIFLGTGTSQGVPMIAFDRHECDLEDRRNWRTRTSVHLEMGGQRIQVDAAPEFRLQCIWNKIDWIDYFILTHAHADHVMGMDDLRRFCDRRDGAPIPVFGAADVLERVAAIFPYAVNGRPAAKGYPAFDLHPMPAVLEIAGGRIRATPLPHGPVTVLGLVFEEVGGKKIAYFTDCKELTAEARDWASGADILVLDGLRPDLHPTHMSIGEAVAEAAAIQAGRTFLIHMTHHVDHARASRELPDGVELAFDGLRVTV